MTKPLLIKFPVFHNYTVNVEIAPNIEKAVERYKNVFKIEGWGGEEETNAITVHENWASYMFLRPRTTPGTIAHESLHVIAEIADKTGMKLDDENVAYHLGYLVDKIDGYVKGRKK